MAKKLYTALGYASSILFWICGVFSLLILCAVIYFYADEEALQLLRIALFVNVSTVALSVLGMILADKKLS